MAAENPTTAGYRWEFLSNHERRRVDAMIEAIDRATAGLWPQMAPAGHEDWEQFMMREKMAAALLQLRSMETSNA